MVWFKAVSINSWQRVIEFGSGTPGFIFFSNYAGDGTINFRVFPGGLRTISVSKVKLNIWVHLAVTFTTTSSTIYFDGSLDATLTGLLL